MWGKLLKFPAHPPYKPIRSTHEQGSETGASKRTKISCGSRSGVVRGRQGSSGVVRGRQGSSGVVRGRQGSSGVVRGRQGSSGVVRGRQGRQGSSGLVRGRQGSSGVVRGRQGSSGVVRGRQGSSGVVRGRQGSSGVVRSRQESSAKIGQLLLPSLMLYIYIYVYIYILYRIRSLDFAVVRSLVTWGFNPKWLNMNCGYKTNSTPPWVTLKNVVPHITPQKIT